MRAPIRVRALTADEHDELVAGLRSPDAFVLRRCQILLASAAGAIPGTIATNLSCDEQTVRNAIHAAFTPEQAEQLRALLHQSPRTFGRPTSLWTLPLAAEVSFEQGVTTARVSGETIRATLVRLGVRWRRAKEWNTSPDPAYARKKGRVIA